MKKVVLQIICLLAVFSFGMNVFADEKKETTNEDVVEPTKVVNAYVFSKENCPYCEALKTYLQELKDDKKFKVDFEIVEYRVWDNEWNQDEKYYTLMNNVAEKFGDKVDGAPYLVIGDSFSVSGYAEEYEKDIKKAIKDAYADEEYVDLVAKTANELPEEPVETSDTGVIVGILAGTVCLVGLFVFFSKRK